MANTVQGTLELDFVGSSAGLQDAVMASQRALVALQQQSSSVSFTIGRIMRTIVAPIAGAVLSAFAAKKALADFAASSLPGAAGFNRGMALMKQSMLSLSQAVGELLAPMAERTAGIIKKIADTLAPIIRIISATIPNIATFLKQLGSNLLAALEPLLPTVFGFIRGLVAGFKGIDWAGLFGKIRAAWNTAWSAIVEFMAPIIVRIASLIETIIRVVRAGLALLQEWFIKLVSDIADMFGITLPGAMQGVMAAVQAVQVAIMIAISAIEIAIQNVPLLFALLMESASVALEFMQKNWSVLGAHLISVFSTVAQNLGAIFASIGAPLLTIIEWLGQSFIVSFNEAWDIISSNMVSSFFRAITKIGAATAIFLASGPAGIIAATESGLMDKIFAEIDLQNPYKGWKGKRIPMPEAKWTPPPLQDMPPLPGMDPPDLEKLNALIDRMKAVFGDGIAKAIQDSLDKAPELAAALAKALPQIQLGVPGARLDNGKNVGALMFGTAEAFAKENNSESTNPLVPLAKQQVVLTQAQLVEARAAARAAERQARVANF